MRVLPEFTLERLPESYPGSTNFYAVTKEPDKYPWLREKYFLELGYDDREESAKKNFNEFTNKWIRGFINPQEYKDLWAKVDADEVSRIVSEMLGLPEEFNPKFEKVIKFDDYYKVDEFKFVSEVNLAPSNPIVHAAWSKFHITVWNSWGMIDEKTGEIHISLRLNFSYSHHDGGSNGAEFCSVRVYDDRLEFKSHKGTTAYKFDEMKSNV